MTIRAAGAVLWRRSGDGPQLALVHRPRYDDWSLPKGKVDAGESMPAAAVREVGEETGIAVRLGGWLGDVHYEVSDGAHSVPKLVRYWAAEQLPASRGYGAPESPVPFVPNAETDELRWLTPAQATALLSYAHDVAVVERFVATGAPDAVVALVRHAKAGNRANWPGHDDLRPLTPTGREQARHLAALLALFGPDRVGSAPPVRCRDTVAPLAARLGIPVAVEPLLGEEGYWLDPVAGLARIGQLAADGGVTAVCSQGGVIPDVVGELLDAAGLGAGVEVTSRKASTWVLGFTEGKLRTADHYGHPSGDQPTMLPTDRT